MSKGKRIRERRARMAEQELEENEVWDCSGMKQHSPFCENPLTCGRRLLDDLDRAIMEENRAWANAGMNIAGIRFNGFLIETKIDATIQTLIGAGVATQDQFDEVYKPMLLDRLQTIRLMNEAEVRKQRIMAMGKGIIGPNGEVLS